MLFLDPIQTPKLLNLGVKFPKLSQSLRSDASKHNKYSKKVQVKKKFVSGERGRMISKQNIQYTPECSC